MPSLSFDVWHTIINEQVDNWRTLHALILVSRTLCSIALPLLKNAKLQLVIRDSTLEGLQANLDKQRISDKKVKPTMVRNFDAVGYRLPIKNNHNWREPSYLHTNGQDLKPLFLGLIAAVQSMKNLTVMRLFGDCVEATDLIEVTVQLPNLRHFVIWLGRNEQELPPIPIDDPNHLNQVSGLRSFSIWRGDPWPGTTMGGNNRRTTAIFNNLRRLVFSNAPTLRHLAGRYCDVLRIFRKHEYDYMFSRAPPDPQLRLHSLQLLTTNGYGIRQCTGGYGRTKLYSDTVAGTSAIDATAMQLFDGGRNWWKADEPIADSGLDLVLQSLGERAQVQMKVLRCETSLEGTNAIRAVAMVGSLEELVLDGKPASDHMFSLGVLARYATTLARLCISIAYFTVSPLDSIEIATTFPKLDLLGLRGPLDVLVSEYHICEIVSACTGLTRLHTLFFYTAEYDQRYGSYVLPDLDEVLSRVMPFCSIKVFMLAGSTCGIKIAQRVGESKTWNITGETELRSSDYEMLAWWKRSRTPYGYLTSG